MSRKKTTLEFINDARAVHGDKYNYSDVKYVNNHTLVDILCSTHGLFKQRPLNHVLSKQGCPTCGGTKKSDTSDFISKSNIIHGGKYTYCNSIYINNRSKVIITCPEHGDFEQTASDHLSGYGCSACGGVGRIDTESFMRRSSKTHGGFYTYSKSKYINKDTKVIITCPAHGDFEQTPHNHYNGKQGCPSCSKSGFDSGKQGYMYFLLSEGCSYVKIGITNNVRRRTSVLRRTTPFEFDVVKVVKIDGKSTYNVETSLHSLFESANLTGFNGCTEWFKYDIDKLNHVMSLFPDITA